MTKIILNDEDMRTIDKRFIRIMYPGMAALVLTMMFFTGELIDLIHYTFEPVEFVSYLLIWIFLAISARYAFKTWDMFYPQDEVTETEEGEE